MKTITILIAITIISFPQKNFKPSINGQILNLTENQFCSPNGRFSYSYNVKSVTDENRTLENLKLFENGSFLFELNNIPGADVSVSNNGLVVIFNHDFHFKQETTLYFYNKFGLPLYTKTIKNGNSFSFSDKGNYFIAGNTKEVLLINPFIQTERNFNKGLSYSFCEEKNIFLSIDENGVIEIVNNGEINRLSTGMQLPRKVLISSDGERVYVINKNYFKIFDTNTLSKLYEEEIDNPYSFRDLVLNDNNLYVGIHERTKEYSKGIMKIYSDNFSSSKTIEGEKRFINPGYTYTPKDGQITWPFVPFDSTHQVWNHYEQHMGGYGAGYSYLHQGLDIITPIAEPTYAVKPGIVKCVLTLGGAIYWRLAIADEQISDWSNGWLYAHLIENTIQFSTGDTVELHDYLGDIVAWTSSWGHIHFVEIRDSGLVWRYDDNEWGINFNPLLVLNPVNDTIAPVFENVFPNQKFAFCLNESSTYLNSDSLYGEIDIIVKVVDYIGNSEWQQPAFTLHYWIKRISDNEIIKPRTLASILNHQYSFYSGDNYEPYATLLYKRDNLLTPTSWMSLTRNYHHILTNNDGDSIITLDEKQLAFNTMLFNDGEYRIYVEACDPAGNCTIDSMNVNFKNGTTNVEEEFQPNKFILFQNFPNPFNPSTTIYYILPQDEFVTLKVFDILGKETVVLIDNKLKEKGIHNYQLSNDNYQLSSGVYFYQLRAGDFIDTKKMIYLR